MAVCLGVVIRISGLFGHLKHGAHVKCCVVIYAWVLDTGSGSGADFNKSRQVEKSGKDVRNVK